MILGEGLELHYHWGVCMYIYISIYIDIYIYINFESLNLLQIY